jgi:hypothetical protein
VLEITSRQFEAFAAKALESAQKLLTGNSAAPDSDDSRTAATSSPVLSCPLSKFDPDAAAQSLKKNYSDPAYQPAGGVTLCAKAVADAIDAGLAAAGQPKLDRSLATSHAAQDYGPVLTNSGYRLTAEGTAGDGKMNICPLTGTVVIVDGYDEDGVTKSGQDFHADPYGHMAMYTGTGWYSYADQGDNAIWLKAQNADPPIPIHYRLYTPP